jgi:hypothetical protein
MREASLYWSPVCELVSQLRCWARIAWRVRGSTWDGRWGQLLTMPTEGYLEASGGPVPIKDVEWVEISTRRIVGGIAGRPKQTVDIKDDLLSRLRGTLATWELRESTWSVEGILDEEPVQVLRILNPFALTAAPLS